MSRTFQVPEMPLTIRWHRNQDLALPVPPDGWHEGPCAQRNTLTGSQAATGLSDFGWNLLLVPKGTDIRGPESGHAGDIVECPMGSGLYHLVFSVQDRWKGFSNEYRMVVAQQLDNTLGQPGGPWWVYPQP